MKKALRATLLLSLVILVGACADKAAPPGLEEAVESAAPQPTATAGEAPLAAATLRGQIEWLKRAAADEGSGMRLEVRGEDAGEDGELCLYAENVRLSDFPLLAQVTRLEQLSLELYTPAFPEPCPLEFLASLPALRYLHVSCYPKPEPCFFDLAPLAACRTQLTLLELDCAESYALSGVRELRLERLLCGAEDAAELAKIGRADYLYLAAWRGSDLSPLAALQPIALNFNDGSANPPKIDLNGVQALSTVEAVQIHDCTVLDPEPLFEMEKLKTLLLSVDATERNLAVFAGQSSPILDAGADRSILGELDLNIPVEQLEAFLDHEDTVLLLTLRWN